MTASASVLPSLAPPRKEKRSTMLHTIESGLAARIATNAAGLRFALNTRHGKLVVVRRSVLRALIEDMEAWAAQLDRADTEAAILLRSIAA